MRAVAQVNNNIKLTTFWIVKALLAGVLIACTKTNEQRLILDGYCAIDTPSYAKDLVPVINKSCMPCHNAVQQQGGVELDSFSLVSGYVHLNTLLPSIRHDAGAMPMPSGSEKLDSCYIQLFELWAAQGTPDN